MLNTRGFGKRSKPEAGYEVTMSGIVGTLLSAAWITFLIIVLVAILVAVFRLVRSQGKKKTKIIVGTLVGLLAIWQVLIRLLLFPSTDGEFAYLVDVIGAVYCGVISIACFTSASIRGRTTRE